MLNNKRKYLYTLIYFSKFCFSRKNVYFFNKNLFSSYLNILTFIMIDNLIPDLKK